MELPNKKDRLIKTLKKRLADREWKAECLKTNHLTVVAQCRAIEKRIRELEGE